MADTNTHHVPSSELVLPAKLIRHLAMSSSNPANVPPFTAMRAALSQLSVSAWVCGRKLTATPDLCPRMGACSISVSCPWALSSEAAGSLLVAAIAAVRPLIAAHGAAQMGTVRLHRGDLAHTGTVVTAAWQWQ